MSRGSSATTHEFYGSLSSLRDGGDAGATQYSQASHQSVPYDDARVTLQYLDYIKQSTSSNDRNINALETVISMVRQNDKRLRDEELKRAAELLRQRKELEQKRRKRRDEKEAAKRAEDEKEAQRQRIAKEEEEQKRAEKAAAAAAKAESDAAAAAAEEARKKKAASEEAARAKKAADEEAARARKAAEEEAARARKAAEEEAERKRVAREEQVRREQEEEQARQSQRRREDDEKKSQDYVNSLRVDRRIAVHFEGEEEWNGNEHVDAETARLIVGVAHADVTVYEGFQRVKELFGVDSNTAAEKRNFLSKLTKIQEALEKFFKPNGDVWMRLKNNIMNKLTEVFSARRRFPMPLTPDQIEFAARTKGRRKFVNLMDEDLAYF